MKLLADRVDSPPAGWFVLNVLRDDCRGWNWSAMMIDINPEEALFRPSDVRSVWVRIAGKHKSREAAWTAIEAMMATRH